MWLRVLGSAAGGGFPQWNCGCPACRAVRDGSRPAQPRTQSSVAVSADRERWFLINASPDIRAQLAAYPDLHPGEGRRSPFDAVLLTDAELDHTLGLLLMREGGGVTVHCTEASHETLQTGTSVLRTLEKYCPVDWHPVVPGKDVPLGEHLSYRAFDVPTAKKARFRGSQARTSTQGFDPGTDEGRVVGYRITDERTGRFLVHLPGVQEFTPEILDELRGSAALLVDGTCWTDDEMITLGLANKTCRSMGHSPVGGPDGSLAVLAPLPIERKIYIHINNTNPILLDDSPERRHVEEQGMEVAMDGLELQT